MFIPPVDDVKPIPVPVEIYTQCITDASRFFGIDAELVFTLFDNEGGKVGTFSRNKNGTYDIGPCIIPPVQRKSASFLCLQSACRIGPWVL
ncbi:hypothetical protein ACNERN_005019, partial [Escherichia coli]